jgi:AcrR family transcriptional regulator
MTSRPYKSAAREEASGRTRARIVAAAHRILGSLRGGRDFSLDAAARAAGVTRLTVYNQFGSRRALLEAVFDDCAKRGGLDRIAEAMADAEPHSSLRKIIAIFCDFWGSDTSTLAWLHAAATGDAEFEDSLHERNERRRQLLTVLVRRMTAGKSADQAKDLVDTLFALTSLRFFADLATGGRSKSDVCAMIQMMASDAMKRVLG